MTAATAYPLIHGYQGQTRFAWRGDAAITQQQALADICTAAKSLDGSRTYFNLCEDRYLFTIAFAAVCLAGTTNLLPQARSPGALDSLRNDYPSADTLDDERVAAGIAAAPPAPAPAVPARIDADHLAAIVFTSGSTGQPSPQVKRWGDLQTGADLCRQRFFHAAGAANIVATVPPQHMYGLETSVLTALLAGQAAHAVRPFMPWDVARALAEMDEPRVLVITPVHLEACLQAGLRMSALRMVISATAPLGAEMAAAAEAAWETEVHEIYGCTEAGSLASRRTVADPAWTLYPDMRLERRGCHYFLHGPQLPEPVALSDELEALDECQFRLLGRTTDMLKLAGKRMSLSDLTGQLLAIDGIADAVVFVPNGGGDRQRPAALVVAPDMIPGEIAARLARRIDPVFVPRPLLRVERLPRNAVGKLPRAELEALLQRTRQGRA